MAAVIAGQPADLLRRTRESFERLAREYAADGAFLVKTDRASAFERTVDRWAKRLSERACEMTLTGPWPPYSFAQP